MGKSPWPSLPTVYHIDPFPSRRLRVCDACGRRSFMYGSANYGPVICPRCGNVGFETEEGPDDHDTAKDAIDYDGPETVTRIPA